MNSQLKRSLLSRYVILWVIVIGALLALVIGAYATIHRYNQYVITRADTLEQVLPNQERTAVVFGSAVNYITGEPRPIVQARLDAAIKLYDNNYVSRIIVSGHEDRVAMDYNEPEIMAAYLRNLGVSEDDITQDTLGDNSYLTCKHAKEIYQLDTAVLITQNSHINRTLFLCRSMGIDAYGVSADAVSSERGEILQRAREAFSNIKAVIDIHVRYNMLND